jgi:hypothetical protein
MMQTELPGMESKNQFESLAVLCRKPITVEIVFDNEKFTIEARRLTPAEDRAIDDIVAPVIPPIIKGKTPDDDRTDWTNADFIRRKAAAEVQARSLGLYMAVPGISAAKPGLVKHDEITAHVQSLFNEQILGLLWQAVRDGGVSKASLVNFTSPSASPAA